VALLLIIINVPVAPLLCKLIDCKGGILAYSNSSGFDGRSYYNIAEFSRLVSDYENVFVNRKTNAKFIACDLPKNDTIVLEDNNRKLVILMNGNNNIKNFSITFQENQNGIDYYSKEKFEDIKTISGTISPMSIKVFVINNALN
jgi:hypothetical protein